MQRILYIQHAGGLGGSCMSLLFLIQGLDRSQYEPVVACIHPTQEVIQLYKNAGIETLYWPGISPLEHTQLGWAPVYDLMALQKFANQLVRFNRSAEATQALIDYVKPNIVHLNSLVLAPSAVGTKRAGKRLVWHVREPVHPGHLGVRRRMLSHLFVRLADEGIFISEYDRQQLTRGAKGRVIHNFVDFERFDHTLDGNAQRHELGLDPDVRVVLFLGGQMVVKGIFPLLKAMPLLVKQVPQAHLLVANGAYHPSGRLVSRIARFLLPKLGNGTVAQRIDGLIATQKMQSYVHLLDWRSDIPQLLAASDLIVFPSIAPHFARPVIEAGAMRKPVVVSRLGSVAELVEHEKTGLLVPPNEPLALANAMARVLSEPSFARALGDAGHEQSLQRFNAAINISQTAAVYDDLL